MADPRDLIDQSPMSRFQWGVVAIMVGLNALDGFDVLSISFASPGLAAAWHVERAALGFVLSTELVGMSLGSFILGGAADRFGRRVTILTCLVIMATGMFGAASARGVLSLSAWRVLTGIGIGGMLASTNAAVAEASNVVRRNLSVVLMAGGYPLGAIVGGIISSHLLRSHEWNAVFLFGGSVTLAFIPLIWWLSPESISFLAQRGGAEALGKINRTLARMGHPPADRLPDLTTRRAMPIAGLFRPPLARPTVLLTIAYLAHIMTFYFILKWIPKIVVDMGFAPAEAAGVLVWANVGGALGSLLLGLLTLRLRLPLLTICAMLASTALVIWFGRGQDGLAQLSLIAACAGFCTNAGVVGLYALVAGAFPTRVRASATGFVIGVGRGGSALAPALAGLLFAAGYALSSVATCMAVGSSVAAASIALFARRPTTLEPNGSLEPHGSAS